MPPTTRRQVLGTALAGVAAVAVATPEKVLVQSAPNPHPDADLIELCAQFDAVERRIMALHSGSTRIEDNDERDAAIASLDTEQDPLLERITTMRAKTLDGLRAKARSLDLFDPDRETSETEGYLDQRLFASLMRDLVGEGAHALTPATEAAT